MPRERQKLRMFERPKGKPAKFNPQHKGEIVHKGKDGKIYNQSGCFGKATPTPFHKDMRGPKKVKSHADI